MAADDWRAPIADWLLALGEASWQGTVALALVGLLTTAARGLTPVQSAWLWRLAYLRFLLALLAHPAGAPSRLGWSLLPSAVPLLGLLWLAGVLALVARVAFGWRSAARLRGESVPIEDLALQRTVAELSRRLRLRRVPPLATAPCAGPMVVGLLRPVILLPEGLTERCTAADLRLILAHELAHLRRGDLLWAWLATAVHVLFFFHPLVWPAYRHWRHASETACDDLAVRITGVRARDYGVLLLRLAGGPSAARWTPSTATAGDAEAALLRRLRGLAPEPPPSRAARLLALCSAAVSTAVLLLPW